MIKVALVHDWFNEAGGAEMVVREILICFPEAEVFCLFDFFGKEDRDYYLFGKKTHRSIIQYMPFARKRYRNYFPLFPAAIEGLKLKEFDVIISSSSCVAKGIRTRPGQLHISYCHSPARYAWDLKDDYLRMAGSKLSRKVLNYFFEKLRRWDVRSSLSVDHFIANSIFVGKRIERFFHRDSTVIYPPVDVTMKEAPGPRGDYYITVSRLVTYKNVDLIIEAFRQMPELKLEVAGTGPLRKQITRNLPPNVTYLGYISEEMKYRKIAGAKAFIAAATEDFGISIVEAQSYCTPVIIPSIGGYMETVNENTGSFVQERSVEGLIATIRKFDKGSHTFLKQHFEDNIRRFSIERFHDEFKTFVNEKIDQHFAGKQP